MQRIAEKRSSPRITAVIPVVCRVMKYGPNDLPSLRHVTAKPSEFQAKTINVSRDGVLIHSNLDLIPRAQLAMSMNSPNDGHPIRLTAEVAWSRHNSIELFGKYAAGLRVKRINGLDRLILTDFFNF